VLVMTESRNSVSLRQRLTSTWGRGVAAVRGNRVEVGLFLGIVAVASILRLWDLTRVGFRGDEAVYAGQAAVLAGDHAMDRYFILASRGNSNFLIYQEVVSFFYRLFGVSDLTARVVSAVFSILTVVALYFVGRVLYGRRAAALGAGALALSSYAVGLGRLALLDSTATFFIVMAVLFLALWLRSPREDQWLCCFAAATMLAAQAKVAGILILVVFAALLLVNGAWRMLRWQAIVKAVLTGLLALVPAILQVAAQPGALADFLGSSLKRRSVASWDYYIVTLLHAEGAAILIALALGMLVAAMRPRRADILPWLWLAVFAVFFAIYPLKAFNYLLPLVPALALLGGRGLSTLRMPRVPQLAVTTALAVVCTLFAAPALASAVRDDSSAGLREAARWLAANAPSNAGVMAISQGSGQYVYSFYGQRDAYPYGRFRIATVLPGGSVVTPQQTPPGQLPLDWVTDRPENLIQNGTVSYLIYATGALDDPPEQSQIISSQTERQFRSMIEAFGGQLVHQVMWDHEVRAYVYKVTKRLERPNVTFHVVEGRVEVKGAGFVVDSNIALSYHGIKLDTGRTDSKGSVAFSVKLPKKLQRPYHLVLTDAQGNYASARGLPAPVVNYSIKNGQMVIKGKEFSSKAPVRIDYHGKTLTHTTASNDGTVTAQLPLPADAKPRFQLRLTDAYGLSAWTTGIKPAVIRFTVRNSSATVTGEHYTPSATVNVSYHGKIVGRPHADQDGKFSMSFVLPKFSQPRYRLVAADANGHRAVAIGLVAEGP
jgi:Dolichyl-phosphate-mannose-protein mannosyltransferase